MNSSPVMKAVISASRVDWRMRRAGIGVRQATNPGRIHSVSSSDIAAYPMRNTRRRPSCSASAVPTVTAAIANRPSGVRRSENRLARPSTRSRT